MLIAMDLGVGMTIHDFDFGGSNNKKGLVIIEHRITLKRTSWG